MRSQLKIVAAIVFLAPLTFLAFLHPATPAPRKKVFIAKAMVAVLMEAADAYRRDIGEYPPEEMGLRVLRFQPRGVEGWKGPYLTNNIRLDPWGHPFIYKFPGPHPDEPGIASLGADGRPGGEGNDSDIVSWKQ